MMLAAVVVGIMAFTACGGGGGTSAGGDDSDPTDIPEPQEDANEPLYGTWFGVSGSNVITKPATLLQQRVEWNLYFQVLDNSPTYSLLVKIVTLYAG